MEWLYQGVAIVLVSSMIISTFKYSFQKFKAFYDKPKIKVKIQFFYIPVVLLIYSSFWIGYIIHKQHFNYSFWLYVVSLIITIIAFIIRFEMIFKFLSKSNINKLIKESKC